MRPRFVFRENPRGDSPKMTRQHFEFIAQVIKWLSLGEPEREIVARAFASALKVTNPAFNEDSFLRATQSFKNSSRVRKNPRKRKSLHDRQMERFAAGEKPRTDLFKPPYNVEIDEERDNLNIWLSDRDDKNIAHWHDDEARQMIEDGFFVGNKGKRRMADSVVEYARTMGWIK